MAIKYFPLRFNRDDPAQVVDHMVEMLRLRDGLRWVNFRPDLPADVLYVVDRRPSWFSGRGPSLPTATWVPASTTRRGELTPIQAGLAHGKGHDARRLLREAGVDAPEGWTVEQDHPKRGFTFEVPLDQDPAIAVDFLVRAGIVVSAIPVDDRWVAVMAVR